MFSFSINRKFNSATLATSVENFLPFNLRLGLVKQHVHIAFSPEGGGYSVSSCYWAREELDESMPMEFDAFCENFQDTRLWKYDPKSGNFIWNISGCPKVPYEIKTKGNN